MADVAPETLVALAAFATRFATPTAILGALFIPSPNGRVVTQGTLPDHPDVSYRLDRPEGMLTLSSKASDGSDITIRAQNRNGIYVDVETGKPIGRALQRDFFIDADAVRDAIEAKKSEDLQASANAEPNHKSDEPKLCPAPAPDTPHGASERAKDYEDDVHVRVNPLAPIPSGFAVMLISPVTGEPVYFDDCFRYAGDLVDGDMKKGDLADAKGPAYASLLAASGLPAERTMERLVKQARRQIEVADALGLGLKWYFAEEGAADAVRKQFKEDNRLSKIVIAFMPPRRRK